MLLLVTIFLVVVGTISLVIGFVQTSLLPIYISIACSVLAAVVLLIFSRMTAKSQQVVTADGGPAPLDMGRAPAERQPEPAYAGTGLLAGSSGGESFAPDAGYGDEPGGAGVDLDDDLPLEDDFPIERYDTRRVGEILPLLAELDLDELDIVREHEEQGKSRATVLARIDQLIDQLEAEDRAEAASRFDEPAIPVATPGAGRGDDMDDMDDVDDDADLEEPAPDLAPLPPPPPTQAVSVAALPDDDGYFPIEDYDDLRASEILPLLPELDDDELVMVQRREQATVARSSILRRIDALLLPGSATDADAAPAPDLEMTPVAVPDAAPSDSAAKKAAGRRAPAARKTPAKKAPAAKVPAAKKVASAAPPVKKAPAAKKAAATTTKAGRTGTAAKKSAPAAEVAKAPAKKAAGRVAKAPPTKAPPAKVAAARAAAATKGGGTAKAAKATRKTTKS